MRNGPLIRAQSASDGLQHLVRIETLHRPIQTERPQRRRQIEEPYRRRPAEEPRACACGSDQHCITVHGRIYRVSSGTFLPEGVRVLSILERVGCRP